MKNTLGIVLGCMLALLMVSAPVMAADGGVGFSRNRLVYMSTDRALSLTVSNHGSTPYLVQAGVSADNQKAVKAPFIVTPPLFRLEGKSQNVMRIVGSGAELPKDRESVFYFYATTIPGQAKTQNGEVEPAKGVGASVSISMKTVLKLFWRPANLPVTAEAALKQVQFVSRGKSVVIKNPTPYYQSFAVLEFDGKRQNTNTRPSMVAPFGELSLPADGLVKSVTWSVMNDYGGTTDKVTQPTVSADG